MRAILSSVPAIVLSKSIELVFVAIPLRVTRQVQLVEQKLLTLPEQPSSSLAFSEVRVTRSLLLCVMFWRSLFVLFLLATVLCVLIRYTDADYLFGIFDKLFLARFIIDKEQIRVGLGSE